MSVDEAIQRLDHCILQLKAARAERWLSEWPLGHPEQPKMPAYVAQYLAARDAKKE